MQIAVRGAGVVGLWQALTLARAGHDVTLYERSPTPFAAACSPFAGAMLAPRCEEESAEPVIRALGERSIALWLETYPGTVANGTLIVAPARDRVLIDRFARMTQGGERLDRTALAQLEPDLANRFTAALYYPGEAHLAPDAALAFLLDVVQAAGVRLKLGEAGVPEDPDLVIDCRGLAAKDNLPTLRGVRGERIVVQEPRGASDAPRAVSAPRFRLHRAVG